MRLSYERGETSVSLGDLGALRCVSAGVLPPHAARELYSGETCRFITGEGVHVAAGNENATLTGGEGIVLPRATLYAVQTGENPAAYVDFIYDAFVSDGLVRITDRHCLAVAECVTRAADADSGLQLAAALSAVLGAGAEVPSADDTFAGVKQYLDRFFYLPVSVEKLSEAAGYSRGYFTAKFTREAGCSPYRYVTERRMRAAEELLQNTDASVGTVAAACGYTGIERFSEMFRLHTGLSPRAYRKRHRPEA